MKNKPKLAADSDMMSAPHMAMMDQINQFRTLAANQAQPEPEPTGGVGAHLKNNWKSYAIGASGGAAATLAGVLLYNKLRGRARK